MTDEQMRERLARVNEKIDAAIKLSGRDRGEVRLLAVSKFHPASAIASLAEAGQLYFGENYVQEALAKREALAGRDFFPELRWDMIGHVQSRKAGQVAGAFAMIHTLDSLKLAKALEKHLQPHDLCQDALIEVNIGDEAQKAGVAPAELPELAESVLLEAPHLRLRGLMCLPPVFDAGEAARPYFSRLRELRDQLETRLGLELPELSMGMSGDFPVAIEEGATIARVGSAIFGPRPAKHAALI